MPARVPSLIRWALLGASATLCSASCATIAGLDEDFTVGSAGGGGPSTGTGSAVSGGGSTGVGGAAGGTATGNGGTPLTGCDPGFECVPAIAAGRFARAIAGQATCDGPWQTPTIYVPHTQPGCHPCSCAAPQPGTCTRGNFYAYTSNDCNSGSLGNAPQLSCIQMSSSWHRAYRFEPSTPSAATCASSGGGPRDLDETTVCTLPTAPTTSCGAGWICVPEGTGELCNLLPSGASCDASYGSSRPVAQVASDDRICSCSCDASTGQSCNASATLYDASGCSTGFVGTIPANSQCTDLPDVSQGSIAVDVGTWTGGSCAAISTEGSVEFGTAEQLCCRP